MVEQFHARGVRVLFPVMLWDQRTHDPGAANWEASARAMKGVNSDGLNGDTLDGFPLPFVTASDAQHHPVALEPEGGVSKTRSLTHPEPVGVHPEAVSPFGVLDLVGNVWQWTDEYRDDHTRAAVLRGGSYYQPQGSIWYFPPTYRLDEHGKYLLLSPGRDRAGTIGFRCVMDAR